MHIEVISDLTQKKKIVELVLSTNKIKYLFNLIEEFDDSVTLLNLCIILNDITHYDFSKLSKPFQESSLEFTNSLFKEYIKILYPKVLSIIKNHPIDNPENFTLFLEMLNLFQYHLLYYPEVYSHLQVSPYRNSNFKYKDFLLLTISYLKSSKQIIISRILKYIKTMMINKQIVNSEFKNDFISIIKEKKVHMSLFELILLKDPK
jgi:hypothetical protein